MTNLLLLSGTEYGTSFFLLLLYAIFIGGYIWLCHLVGKYAEKRGRDYWLFLFIALVLNPVIGIIIAVLAGESDAVQRETIRREVKNALEQERNNQQQDNQDIQDYQEIEENQE